MVSSYTSKQILISAILYTLIPFVTSICTSWTEGKSNADSSFGFSTQFFTPVEFIACSPSQSAGCTFQKKTYNLSISRSLNISFSPTEATAVFNLVSQNFNQGPNPYFIHTPFLTLNASISTAALDSTNIDHAIAAGNNATLGWTSFMLYNSGRLGGCQNASLEGMSVMAVAPYWLGGNEMAGVLAGTWSAYEINGTSGKGSVPSTTSTLPTGTGSASAGATAKSGGGKLSAGRGGGGGLQMVQMMDLGAMVFTALV